MSANWAERFHLLDAFPKVEASQQRKSAFGGFATVLVSFVLSYLIWGEFQAYWTPVAHHEFLVDHSISHELLINIDVTFAMPCRYLSVDVLDVTETGNHFDPFIKKIPTVFSTGRAKNLLEEHQLLPETRGESDDDNLDGNGEHNEDVARLIRESRLIRTRPRVDPIALDFSGRTDLAANGGGGLDGDSCRVLGTVQVNKLAGNFHFTALGHGHGGYHTPHAAINFTHRIDKFSFGINYPGLEDPLNDHYQPATSHLESFTYLVSVVPTIYTDAAGHSLVTNQYAVKDYLKVYDESPRGEPTGIPGVFFKYDMEPISVYITETRQSLPRFLTRVCAAVGGVFVCVGLLHHLVFAVVSWWTLARSGPITSPRKR
ncbi:hypothetical protein IWQ60_007236 [Tieghemiomyces parasiticus]|uniref:Uncharacterized protein n=1 Tax=Tieghemiomyces parasiticus TaxID=78921 RepID=A0A9W8DUP0_9FUNG|nr:hypothetical protein IWQ60_007236 [Tieghemiomyces parasiticus]